MPSIRNPARITGLKAAPDDGRGLGESQSASSGLLAW